MTKVVLINGEMRNVFEVSNIQSKMEDGVLSIMLDDKNLFVDKSEVKKLSKCIDESVFNNVIILYYNDNYDDYTPITEEEFRKRR